MPSFLSKLFRKKKSPDASTDASKTSSKQSRKSSKKKGSKADKVSAKAAQPEKQVAKVAPPQELRRPSNGTGNFSNSNSGKEANVRVLSSRKQVPNAMDRHHTELVLRSVHSAPQQQAKPLANGYTGGNSHNWAGPVDLDESDLGSDPDENHIQSRSPNPIHNQATSSPSQQQQQQQQRLSVQQLHRFDRQQQKREATAQFYMAKEEPSRFSAGHVPVDDMNRSDASSSSFNLSTDAEDTEYENLKRRGVVPNPPVLDSSHLSGVSSPTNYNTDGDNSIFPALQTDDEGTLAERDSHVSKVTTTDEDEEGYNKRGNLHVTTVPKRNPIKEHNLVHEYGEEERAWTISPTKDGAHPFPFHNPASPTSRRSFTSPRLPLSPKGFRTSALSTARTSTNNEFANFADFSNVTFPADTAFWGAPKSGRTMVDGTPPPVSPRKISHLSSASAADMTLADILAQAKSKRGSSGSQRSAGSGSRRISSSSVNSAPAVTAKYLRQHHNLRPARYSSDQDGTTPVSDIIDSLEIANASRHSTGGGNASKALARSSQGQDPSRIAKDRLRERRRREGSSSRRPGDSNQNTESSDGSDQEASESWLFDEVTGALGPRGIAADLESLSGRSKSSSGNKSHKSHRSHRSHRSHGRSSRRRPSGSKNHHHPSSGESVDSRGSRHSRGSRYSHRSTRSYLSQMSEQSRSVANDLLRLEMQLAMVGSQDNNAAAAIAAAAAGSSASVASRASRKSRTSARRTVAIARRNKVTIQAPPGKLGIILANKADSKGTVVSGVRSSSVLSEKISPGDRIVAIDGEDVSLMTVSEITTIMARKSDFDRTLTVLTTPKHLSLPTSAPPPSQSSAEASTRNGIPSPKSAKDYDSFRYQSR